MVGRTAGPPRTHDEVGGTRRGDEPSAFLRVALVGPTNASAGVMARHTVALAHQLSHAGHDVTLVSWSPDERTGAAADGHDDAYPRTVRSLAWNRPDTWVRTGRHLRAYDTVLIVHTGPAMVPLHLALLRGAGVGRQHSATRSEGHGGPSSVLLCESLLPVRPGAAARNLVSSVLARMDGVLVHRSEEAALAARLGAGRVYAVESLPADQSAGPITDLSAPWAAYVGAIEALAAPDVAAADLGPPVQDEPDAGDDRRPRSQGGWGLAVGVFRLLSTAVSPRVDLTRADLPEWVQATDVLDDAAQADDAREQARRLGLPRTRDGIAAWAALGTLASVVRLVDDGRRSAVLVDESGPRSPLSRWAKAAGFAPVDLGLTSQSRWQNEDGDQLEVDPGSIDVLARVHPGGCDAGDLDETLARASWVLRPGGLLVVTLPLGRPGDELALGPADVRGVVARAHELGFVLVGDLDGDTGRRMRAAGAAASQTSPSVRGAAYGLVRLTLRRR